MIIIKIISKIIILDDNGRDINGLFCAFHLKIAHETQEVAQYIETTTKHYTDDIYILGKYETETGKIYSTHNYDYDLNDKRFAVKRVKILNTTCIAKTELYDRELL